MPPLRSGYGREGKARRTTWQCWYQVFSLARLSCGFGIGARIRNHQRSKLCTHDIARLHLNHVCTLLTGESPVHGSTVYKINLKTFHIGIWTISFSHPAHFHVTTTNSALDFQRGHADIPEYNHCNYSPWSHKNLCLLLTVYCQFLTS